MMVILVRLNRRLENEMALFSMNNGELKIKDFNRISINNHLTDGHSIDSTRSSGSENPNLLVK